MSGFQGLGLQGQSEFQGFGVRVYRVNLLRGRAPRSMHTRCPTVGKRVLGETEAGAVLQALRLHPVADRYEGSEMGVKG